MQALVQAESLFNDGTSLVMFQIAVSAAVGGTAAMTAAGTVLHRAGEFIALAGGGALAGAVVAAGVIVARRRTRTDRNPNAARTARTERELRRDLITAETSELSRLYDAGTISAATRRRLQRNMDLETARLTEGQH